MMLYKVKGFIPKDGRYGGGYEGMIVSASDGIGPLPYVWGTTVVALPKNGIPIGRQMTNVGIYLEPWYGSSLEEAHRALWYWLSIQDHRDDKAWPGWVNNGGIWSHKIYINVGVRFACEGAHCYHCSVNWGVVNCGRKNGLYHQWKNAPTQSEAQRLARQIAELPWRNPSTACKPDQPDTSTQETTMPNPYGATHAEAHKALWLWLAENGTKNKAGWPGWEQNGGPWPMPRQKCFACIDAFDQENHCPKCPLSWGQHYSDTIPCERPGALYDKWLRADKDNRSTLARQIANMPWHDRTKKEEQPMSEQIDYYSLPLITNFTGLEGAKVWHPEKGHGTVTVINCAGGGSFPCVVNFECEGRETFTIDGRRIEHLLPACRLISKPVKEHTMEGFIAIPTNSTPLFYDTQEMAKRHKPLFSTGPFPAKLTWEE